MEKITPYEAHKTVVQTADLLLENIFYEISKNRIITFEEAFDELMETGIDDTNAIGLSLEARLTLLEHHASDYDITLGEVDIDELRGRIEDMTSITIHYLAQHLAWERLTELREFMDSHDLELRDVSRCSSLETLSHEEERDEGEHCTVYTYRNIGEDKHDIDEWQYVHEPLAIYIRQVIPRD